MIVRFGRRCFGLAAMAAAFCAPSYAWDYVFVNANKQAVFFELWGYGTNPAGATDSNRTHLYFLPRCTVFLDQGQYINKGKDAFVRYSYPVGAAITETVTRSSSTGFSAGLQSSATVASKKADATAQANATYVANSSATDSMKFVYGNTIVPSTTKYSSDNMYVQDSTGQFAQAHLPLLSSGYTLYSAFEIGGGNCTHVYDLNGNSYPWSTEFSRWY